MKTKIHFLQTYIVLFLSGIAAMLFSASCSESDSPSTDLIADTSAGETSRVEILIPRNLTRTYISDDEGKDLEGDDYAGKRAVVEWSEDDQLVMWSKAVTEGSALSAPATFTYLAPAIDESDGILFYCKEIAIPANQSNYTYYAVSPVPDSMAGAEATYTVPATQHGTFDEVSDILWAPPVEAKCLTANLRNPINFAFKHVLHAMKITLPDVPFEEGIKTLLVEFPYEVAGKLTVDAETGEARISSEGSKVITLTFDTPKKAGDTLWVVVAPAPNGGEGVTGDVHFTAANADNTQFTFPTPHEAGSGTFDFANLTGGRITPVKLHLTLRPQVDFVVKVTDHSRLGEPITDISSLTLPEGYSAPSLPLGSRVVYPTVKDGETFTVKLFADEVERLNGETLTAVLESEHAEGFEVSNTVANKSLSLSAPYLYAEDFSSTTQSNDLDRNATGGSHTGFTWHGNLSEYGFPSGWSGGRCGVLQGTAVGVWNRAEVVLGGATNLRGALDSPTMSHLKADAIVKLKISFNYSMNRDHENDVNGQHYFSVGVHPNSFSIESILSQSVATRQNDNGFGNNITAIGTEDYTEDFTGSYTHIDKTWEATTGSICTRNSRFVWSVYAKRVTGWGGMANNILYLDNIKVSIVP